MMSDKTKVTGDYNYFGAQKKGPFRFNSIPAVCFLYILVIGLFVFNFLMMARIKVLETETEVMKLTLSNVRLFDDNIIKEIIGFEDEEDTESNDPDQESMDSDQPPKVVVSSDWTREYDYDTYYDQSTENDSKQDEDSYFEILLDKLSNSDNNDNETNDSPTNLSKVEKELNRSKRNIVAATNDGVIINSESYAEKKSKNLTSRYTARGGTVTQYPAQPSAMGSPWPVYPYPYSSTPSYNSNSRKTSKGPSVLSRRSRVKHHEDGGKPFRRIVKVPAWKSLGSYQDSYEDATTTSPEFTVVNFNKKRRVLKPLASAHFNGDTSNYVYGQHSNYLGNGHLRHPQSRFIDWKASDWVQSLGMTDHFTLRNGYLTIKDSGLYFVYSQVYYLDEHDTTGYKVMKNNQAILQCTLTIHSVERRLKGNTCFTAGVEHFAANDKLSIEDITEGMLSKFEVGKSFFGLIKLGDAKIQL